MRTLTRYLQMNYMDQHSLHNRWYMCIQWTCVIYCAVIIRQSIIKVNIEHWALPFGLLQTKAAL